MIPLFAVNMPHEVDAPLLRVLHSGYVGQGPEVEAFEREFGAWIGNPRVVSVNSGTSALTLAYALANLGPGDEVITTPMTCSATNLPILHFGAKIVWADVHPETGLIDPEDVERKITERTKAIVGVDWGGTLCDMDGFAEIVEDIDRPVWVIQDAAHSLGATYFEQKAMRVCDRHITAYSFQAIKHMTTVDGGMLVTPDDATYRRAKLLRWFGIDREAPVADSRIDVDIEEAGYKFHMNDVAAAIGRVQLRFVDDTVMQHAVNAMHYDACLPHWYGKPPEDSGVVTSAYWLYTLLLPTAKDRDEFRTFMLAQGIQVSRVHRRNDEYAVFKPFRIDLPGVTAFSDRMICIPVHWALQEREREQIVDACEAFAKVGA